MNNSNQIGKFWTTNRIPNVAPSEGEYSNLFGRRAYCKDKGLSGKALRECKKQLKESDSDLSRAEKKDLKLERKSGSGLVNDMLFNEGGSGTDMMPPVDDGTQQTRTSMPPQDQGGSRTGLIIGISVGVLALVGLAIYIIKKRKK